MSPPLAKVPEGFARVQVSPLSVSTTVSSNSTGPSMIAWKRASFFPLGVSKVEKSSSPAGESVPQGTLDKIAPGVKSGDVDNVMGALDRLVPGLGGLVRKQAPALIAAGIANLGEKTVLEGKAAQSFPLRFVDGAVFIGPLRFAQTPALF